MPTINYTDPVRKLTHVEDVKWNRLNAAMLEAAANGEIARMQALISIGASDFQGAIHAAKRGGHTLLWKQLEEMVWANAVRKLQGMR